MTELDPPISNCLLSALLYAPCISFLSEWFFNRRGFANGVIFAGNWLFYHPRANYLNVHRSPGTATGGLILPLTLPYMLRTFGPFKSLRILSIVLVVLIAPIMPFMRPRLPELRVRPPHSSAQISQRNKWTHNKPFRLAMAANTLQGFAFFIPILWLPSQYEVCQTLSI